MKICDDMKKINVSLQYNNYDVLNVDKIEPMFH